MTILLEVTLRTGVISPDQLPELVRVADEALRPYMTGGVVISGRLPVWAYAALTHAAHPAAWVATFDPRLGGGVVVQCHTPSGPAVGTVVPTDGATVVRVEF